MFVMHTKGQHYILRINCITQTMNVNLLLYTMWSPLISAVPYSVLNNIGVLFMICIVSLFFKVMVDGDYLLWNNKTKKEFPNIFVKFMV